MDNLRTYWISWGNGNINSAQTLLEICPELMPLYNTPLSSSNHAESNCGQHTLLTCDAINELAGTVPEKYRKILRYATILHDVGKPLCIKEAAPGIYSFPNKNKISFNLARIILDKYCQLPLKDKDQVLALINNCNFPLRSVQTLSEKKVLHRISRECNLELLFNLAMANYTGRIAKNLRSTFESLEGFKNLCINENLWAGKSWEGLLTLAQVSRFGSNAMLARSIIDWFYLTGPIEDQRDGLAWLQSSKKWKWGTLFLTVGAPGSGKTTWLKNNYSMLPIVSTDQIRKQLTGDESNQDHNDEVFNIAHEKICDILNNGKQVAFDATNLIFDNRKSILDLARSLGAQIVYLYFDTSYDVCLSRAKNRKSLPISREVLDSLYANYDYVSSFEYDRIVYNY